MAVLHTPLTEGQPNRAATFNAALQQIEDAILAREGYFVQRTAWTTLLTDTPSINIPVVAGDNTVQLMLKLRSDRAGNTDDPIRIKINSDGVSTYQTVYILSTGPATTAYSIVTGFQIDYGATGATASSGLYSYSVVKLSRASDAEARAGRFETVFQATTGTAPRLLDGSLWYPTAIAVSSIQIVPVNGTNFVAGSQYALYGMP
jgi:hypothetical protein